MKKTFATIATLFAFTAAAQAEPAGVGCRFDINKAGVDTFTVETSYYGRGEGVRADSWMSFDKGETWPWALGDADAVNINMGDVTFYRTKGFIEFDNGQDYEIRVSMKDTLGKVEGHVQLYNKGKRFAGQEIFIGKSTNCITYEVE